MKTISILIPTYNEEENVLAMVETLTRMFETELSDYDHEIVFIDNASKDKTREKILMACNKDPKVRGVFNAKNFGQFNSPYYGLQQTTGDCTVLLCADFQDPVEMIPRFVAEWEDGHKIVCGIKTTSRENGFMYFMRSCYYKVIRKLSDVEQIEHFTGFGLYDKSFINTLREVKDCTPFLRGMVAEFGAHRKDIPYEQARRRAGKTSNNWYTLYDAAMLSFTSYTKRGLRAAVFLGFGMSILSMLVALVYVVLKLVWWYDMPLGSLPILIGVWVVGSIQLFFIGLLGEYIMNINTRVMNRPLVIEEARVNFEEKEK